MNNKTSPAANLTWLEGSLFDSDRYADCLNSSVVVVHLAAVTGKAPAEQYFSVNRDGTQHLIMRCRERQVKNFLYVSSIAATYRDKSHYYYAQSKLEAEEVVRKSGIGYVIVRPTIVLGRDSSAWKSLARLARLPWVPMVGDGSARIQPIDVDDLVDAMIAVIEDQEFNNETFDLGGADVLTVEEFLVKVHRLYCNAEPRILHLPYHSVRRALSWAERYFSSVLPLNAGQLSVFIQDGTIAENRLYAKQRSRMKNIDNVLRLLAQ
jgi:NADH dehydrogenase